MFRSQFLTLSAAALLTCCSLTLTGCDNKETVLEVETPNGEMEVERDRDTGEVEVDVDEE